MQTRALFHNTNPTRSTHAPICVEKMSSSHADQSTTNENYINRNTCRPKPTSMTSHPASIRSRAESGWRWAIASSSGDAPLSSKTSSCGRYCRTILILSGSPNTRCTRQRPSSPRKLTSQSGLIRSRSCMEINI